jgi:hypothetical protein
MGDFYKTYKKNKILEAFAKELVRGAETKRLQRSKTITVHYKGIAKTKGWIIFNTPSQTFPNKKYYQYVKLLDIKDIKSLKDLKKKDVVNLLLNGDISVFCSCPDFLYRGYKYMGYKTGYGIYKENRFPKIRNPRLEGTVCKHMIAVLQVLSSNWVRINKDLVQSYYWKKRYGEEEE